jgi:pyrroline-5-carboxylate reductase
MLQETIGFIGGGNMARSLIGGLLARGLAPRQVVVSDPTATQRDALSVQYGVRTVESNITAARETQVLIFAVKPQQLRAVCVEVAPALGQGSTVISIAAGIRATDLQRWLGGLPVVRAMPNTPALNGCGVSGLFATPDVDIANRRLAETIIGAVGPALWIDEERLMDAVTAVSGSGPAYFFFLIEMLEAAGVQLGLPPDISRKLALETAYGAGQMARSAPVSPATLREQVTSKGGTTEAALKYLESAGTRAIFAGAIAAAAKRSGELADQFGKD